MRVGLDTGGTFTDLVADDGRVAKVLSTPVEPGRAVRNGLMELAAGSQVDLLVHGTTVATNALLERRGATVALVTNQGLADVVEIARQDRPSLYDQWADRPTPLVAREHRYEVAGRLDSRGQELEPVDLEALPDIARDVGAVAVCLLHADLEPGHERAVADALSARGFDVSASHRVSPEFREYERTVTTVVNSYLRPACGPYLADLGGLATEVLVMTSAGGLVGLDDAAARPAALVLSGPAGGVAAGAAVATANGFPDAVTFDMGGTSTDVCLVRGGVPEPAPGRVVGGFALRLPSLDVHTIGAGGGSIARLDAGGALVVGPESAGAAPGPACYVRGGEAATVTDANLVLGRIRSDAAFPELGRLDVTAARAALDRAGVDAAGVARVVNAGMERALRRVSVERGVDPRDLALVAFGGAGPLHACELADTLGMAAVVVPARAGVLSAVGLLCSPRQHEAVRSWPGLADHRGLDDALVALATEARSRLRGDVAVTTAVDCRYEGQSHELTVPTVDDFHDEHRRRNGYGRPDAPVEVVALRTRASLAAPLAVDELPAPGERRPLVGPTVASEPDCTVWVPDGWHADVGEGGAWILRRSRS